MAHINKQAGFGLMGMAFTLVAVGLMISGALFLYKTYSVMERDQITVDYTRAVEKAILDFAAMNKRYPCPASLTATLDSGAFGVEASATCNAGAVAAGTYRANGKNGVPIRVGTIPVRSLNIPDKYMFDGYNHRFIYAVTESHATSGAADIDNDPGAIYVQDTNGNSIVSVSGEAVFAFISPGENPYGAFDRGGNQVMPCSSATGPTATNCSFLSGAADAATFISTSEKNFSGESDGFTQNLAFRANAVKYDWVMEAWSECTGCLEGNQSRTVTCQDHDGNTVADSFCSHSSAPLRNRQCGVPVCRWQSDIGAWGGCS